MTRHVRGRRSVCQGLTRSDGRRPDGLTLIPWREGRSTNWDMTVTDTVAALLRSMSLVCTTSVAEAAVQLEEGKYTPTYPAFSSFPYWPLELWALSIATHWRVGSCNVGNHRRLTRNRYSFFNACQQQLCIVSTTFVFRTRLTTLEMTPQTSRGTPRDIIGTVSLISKRLGIKYRGRFN